MENRIEEAYRTLMQKLFGEVPKHPGSREIRRSVYDRMMKEVQEQYGLTEGDPDFMEWVLTLVGRSPRFIEEDHHAAH